MDISVTCFRAQCLELIRQVEVAAKWLRSHAMARLLQGSPPLPAALRKASGPENLRGSVVLAVEPEDSLLD
jgi:hypothetical protein